MGRTSDARERLIAAAMELLQGSGYQGVGVDELCQRAKVKKGSFYYFFPSKRDLALAAIDARWAATREHFVQAVLGNEGPALARVRAFFDALAHGSAEQKTSTGRCLGCFFGNLSAEMAAHDPKIRARVQAALADLARALERTLREAVERGEVDGIDPRANARALVAYMEGMLLLARTDDDPQVVKELGRLALWLATAPAKGRARRSRSA